MWLPALGRYLVSWAQMLILVVIKKDRLLH